MYSVCPVTTQSLGSCETSPYRKSHNKNYNNWLNIFTLVTEIALTTNTCMRKFALYQQRSPVYQQRYSKFEFTKHLHAQLVYRNVDIRLWGQMCRGLAEPLYCGGRHLTHVRVPRALIITVLSIPVC
jgi:hypothetical protein